MEQRLNSIRTKAKSRTKGLVIVNTGTGKGKTTAALGLLLRAWGWNMRVVMLQFIKSSTANYGEHKAARRLGIEVVTWGAGFTWQAKNVDRSRSLAIELWGQAKEKMTSGSYDMIALDELSYPLQYGWIQVEAVLEALGSRPSWVHVVITGRDVPKELIDFADIVTNMEEVKHPFSKGLKAQQGVEF